MNRFIKQTKIILYSKTFEKEKLRYVNFLCSGSYFCMTFYYDKNQKFVSSLELLSICQLFPKFKFSMHVRKTSKHVLFLAIQSFCPKS